MVDSSNGKNYNNNIKFDKITFLTNLLNDKSKIIKSQQLKERGVRMLKKYAIHYNSDLGNAFISEVSETEMPDDEFNQFLINTNKESAVSGPYVFELQEDLPIYTNKNKNLKYKIPTATGYIFAMLFVYGECQIAKTEIEVILKNALINYVKDNLIKYNMMKKELGGLIF